VSIGLLIIGLALSIGIIINSEIQFNKANRVVTVKGRILFYSNRTSDAGQAIFMLKNGNIKKITPGLFPRFKTNESIIYWTGPDRGFTIYNLNNDIKKHLPFTDKLHPMQFDISPDGKTIVFLSSMDKDFEPWNLYLVDIKTEELKKITNFRDGNAGSPKFSPDGNRIVFSGPKTYEGKLGFSGIWVMDLRNSSMTELTKDLHWGGKYPSWSSDSKKIVFSSYEKNGPFIYNIYTMNSDGSDVKKLTDFKNDAIQPAYSPDDKRICFVYKIRGERRGSELFAINAEGANLTRLTPAKRTRFYPYFVSDKYPEWAK
jgi:Tol biopolymer transport system component